MIQPKTIMMCALCTKIITESGELDKALSQLAIENNVASITMVKVGISKEGYLCEDCFVMLYNNTPLKKKIDQAFKLGGSCGISVPRKWLNKKVIAVLGEE